MVSKAVVSRHDALTERLWPLHAIVVRKDAGSCLLGRGRGYRHLGVCRQWIEQADVLTKSRLEGSFYRRRAILTVPEIGHDELLEADEVMLVVCVALESPTSQILEFGHTISNSPSHDEKPYGYEPAWTVLAPYLLRQQACIPAEVPHTKSKKSLIGS